MHIEFQTKDMQDSVKAIRKIFTKGPLSLEGPKEEDVKDCLVASEKDGFSIESARFGLYCKSRINSTILAPGHCVISRRLLSDTKFSKDSTSFRLKTPNSLEAQNGKFHSTLLVGQETDQILNQKPEKMPKLTVKIPNAILIEAMKRIQFTPVNKKDLKLQIHMGNGCVILVAHDHYRAALFQVQMAEVPDACILTTGPFFASVVTSIPEDSLVEMGFDETGLRIRGGNLDVFQPALQDLEPSQVITYVKQIEERETLVSCTLDAKEALEAVSQVASIVPSSFGEVRVSLEFLKSGKIKAVVESTIGNADHQFDVQDLKTSGEIKSIPVSSKNFSEFLSVLDGEVEIRIVEGHVVLKSQALHTTLLLAQLN